MTKVLVVCKTRMKVGFCLGGIQERSYDMIRLLTPEGANQPEETDFEVGDIWECLLDPVQDGQKPHTEDMRVLRQRFLQRVPNLRQFLLERLNIKQTHKSALFEGLWKSTQPGSAFVSERTGLPDHAHEFWRPVFGLSMRKERGKVYYEYEDPDSRNKFRLRYVGLDEPVKRLPPGSLLHLSLARWWQQPGTREERCFLQLSGWFL